MLGQHLAALHRGRERPVDIPHRALRVGEADRVRLVLFIEDNIADIAELVGLYQLLEATAHLFQFRWRFEVDAARRILALLGEDLRERFGDRSFAQPLLYLVEE